MRKQTKAVSVGGVTVGGGTRITIQSMTNTDTRDSTATLLQIAALREAGCEIVRSSVYDIDCAKAFRAIVDGAGIPVVADVHFDYTLGIAAVENGAHKLRINPGNIGSAENVRKVADCCRAHKIPIRIGVNGGSLERGLLQKYGGPTPEAMVESALSQIKTLEDCGFSEIIISLKGSDAPLTVDACRLFAKKSDYPQHIGVTESGTAQSGGVVSAVGIGTLLMEGIGDTIRVSLAGDPVPEIAAATAILRACGLRGGARVVACPTCGRAGYDVETAAKAVEKRLQEIDRPLRIAVMGCVVNGPGEARESDAGIAGGPGGGVLFSKGKPPKKIPTDKLLEALFAEIDVLAAKENAL